MLLNFSHLELIISNSPRLIDIIVVTEVNIKENCKQLFNLHNYNMYSCLRKNKKGGGILLYVHNKYIFSQNVINSMHFECLMGQIQKTGLKSVSLCAVYRPPDTDKRLFISELGNLLSKHDKKHKLIVIGDTNINLNVHSITTSLYMEMMCEYGLSCGIRNDTRVEFKTNKLSQSCIDHIFVRCTDGLSVNAAVVSTALADHYIIGCACECGPVSRHRPTRMIAISKLDNVRVIKELKNVNWTTALTYQCPDRVLDFVLKKSNIVYDLCNNTI